MRKTWQKPKLVVLVRGRPEEHVLGVCKVAGTPDTGATPSQTDCMLNLVNCEACLDTIGT